MPLFAANKSEANGGVGDDPDDQPFAATAADEEAPPAPPPAPTTARLHLPKKKKDKQPKSGENHAPSLFPNPKQVVTIFSPIVHTITHQVENSLA